MNDLDKQVLFFWLGSALIDYGEEPLHSVDEIEKPEVITRLLNVLKKKWLIHNPDCPDSEIDDVFSGLQWMCDSFGEEANPIFETVGRDTSLSQPSTITAILQYIKRRIDIMDIDDNKFSPSMSQTIHSILLGSSTKNRSHFSPNDHSGERLDINLSSRFSDADRQKHTHGPKPISGRTPDPLVVNNSRSAQTNKYSDTSIPGSVLMFNKSGYPYQGDILYSSTGPYEYDPAASPSINNGWLPSGAQIQGLYTSPLSTQSPEKKSFVANIHLTKSEGVASAQRSVESDKKTPLTRVDVNENLESPFTTSAPAPSPEGPQKPIELSPKSNAKRLRELAAQLLNNPSAVLDKISEKRKSDPSRDDSKKNLPHFVSGESLSKTDIIDTDKENVHMRGGVSRGRSLNRNLEKLHTSPRASNDSSSRKGPRPSGTQAAEKDAQPVVYPHVFPPTGPQALLFNKTRARSVIYIPPLETVPLDPGKMRSVLGKLAETGLVLNGRAASPRSCGSEQGKLRPGIQVGSLADPLYVPAFAVQLSAPVSSLVTTPCSESSPGGAATSTTFSSPARPLFGDSLKAAAAEPSTPDTPSDIHLEAELAAANADIAAVRHHLRAMSPTAQSYTQFLPQSTTRDRILQSPQDAEEGVDLMGLLGKTEAPRAESEGVTGVSQGIAGQGRRRRSGSSETELWKGSPLFMLGRVPVLAPPRTAPLLQWLRALGLPLSPQARRTYSLSAQELLAHAESLAESLPGAVRGSSAREQQLVWQTYSHFLAQDGVFFCELFARLLGRSTEVLAPLPPLLSLQSLQSPPADDERVLSRLMHPQHEALFRLSLLPGAIPARVPGRSRLRSRARSPERMEPVRLSSRAVGKNLELARAALRQSAQATRELEAAFDHWIGLATAKVPEVDAVSSEFWNVVAECARLFGGPGSLLETWQRRDRSVLPHTATARSVQRSASVPPMSQAQRLPPGLAAAASVAAEQARGRSPSPQRASATAHTQGHPQRGESPKRGRSDRVKLVSSSDLSPTTFASAPTVSVPTAASNLSTSSWSSATIQSPRSQDATALLLSPKSVLKAQPSPSKYRRTRSASPLSAATGPVASEKVRVSTTTQLLRKALLADGIEIIVPTSAGSAFSPRQLAQGRSTVTNIRNSSLPPVPTAPSPSIPVLPQPLPVPERLQRYLPAEAAVRALHLRLPIHYHYEPLSGAEGEGAYLHVLGRPYNALDAYAGLMDTASPRSNLSFASAPGQSLNQSLASGAADQLDSSFIAGTPAHSEGLGALATRSRLPRQPRAAREEVLRWLDALARATAAPSFTNSVTHLHADEDAFTHALASPLLNGVLLCALASALEPSATARLLGPQFLFFHRPSSFAEARANVEAALSVFRGATGVQRLLQSLARKELKLLRRSEAAEPHSPSAIAEAYLFCTEELLLGRADTAWGLLRMLKRVYSDAKLLQGEKADTNRNRVPSHLDQGEPVWKVFGSREGVLAEEQLEALRNAREALMQPDSRVSSATAAATDEKTPNLNPPSEASPRDFNALGELKDWLPSEAQLLQWLQDAGAPAALGMAPRALSSMRLAALAGPISDGTLLAALVRGLGVGVGALRGVDWTPRDGARARRNIGLMLAALAVEFKTLRVKLQSSTNAESSPELRTLDAAAAVAPGMQLNAPAGQGESLKEGPQLEKGKFANLLYLADSTTMYSALAVLFACARARGIYPLPFTPIHLSATPLQPHTPTSTSPPSVASTAPSESPLQSPFQHLEESVLNLNVSDDEPESSPLRRTPSRARPQKESERGKGREFSETDGLVDLYSSAGSVVRDGGAISPVSDLDSPADASEHSLEFAERHENRERSARVLADWLGGLAATGLVLPCSPDELFLQLASKDFPLHQLEQDGREAVVNAFSNGVLLGKLTNLLERGRGSLSKDEIHVEEPTPSVANPTGLLTAAQRLGNIRRALAQLRCFPAMPIALLWSENLIAEGDVDVVRRLLWQMRIAYGHHLFSHFHTLPSKGSGSDTADLTKQMGFGRTSRSHNELLEYPPRTPSRIITKKRLQKGEEIEKRNANLTTSQHVL